MSAAIAAVAASTSADTSRRIWSKARRGPALGSLAARPNVGGIAMKGAFIGSLAFACMIASAMSASVSKNGAPVRDQRTHLMCYEDEGPKAVEKKVAVTNQFGTETLTVGGPWTLCEPSLKTVPHQ